ncbi:MAG: ribonuclease R [Clostridia bacterium]|nr:ribonuclease R [Clostridia bacterium]
MDRKERIYSYIKSSEYIPLKEEEMRCVLGVPPEDHEKFSLLLNELESEGKIVKTKKNKYLSLAASNMVCGTLSCSAYGKFGFVTPKDENADDIFINADKLGDAYHNDFVLAAIDVKNPRNGKSEGHIVKILKRGTERITGIVKSVNNTIRIIPDNRKIYADIHINNYSDCAVGDRLLAQITGYPQSGIINACIIKNLGSGDELKSNTEAIINEHCIKEEFDKETLDEASVAPKRVSQKEISKRLDLRDELIITIDGDDARDFDDAVSVKKNNDGTYNLGVHIADVTSYVTAGSALDKEAFERGTSVYLADRVIPMLPVELSNGICSLNPHVNRLTLSVFMTVDENGDIKLDKIAKTVIRSSERMTYNDVASLLEEPSKKLLKKYEYLLPMLKDMKDLAAILHKRREKRGSINFDFPESKVIVNDMGEPIDIIKTERKISHKIIEEFMLVANETVAEFAFWAEMPFVYRVHEAPSPEKTAEFNRFILNFGYSLKGKNDKDNPVHPKAFQQILDNISGSDEELMISTYMLRSLMKAEYKPENLGHFGLAAKYYCHFTSPIRRYPDLMIHRIIKDYLDSKPLDLYYPIVYDASENSSKAEREAEYCERDVDDLMKAAFMSAKIGEVFDARVSSVTGFGIFVQLENTVEGLIRLESMKDDYYEFDEASRTVTGRRHSKVYSVGTVLKVVLVRCDLLSRQIDFVRKEDYYIFEDYSRSEKPVKKCDIKFKKPKKHIGKRSYTNAKKYKSKKRKKRNG